MGSEGDYSYTEPQVQRSSIAKLELYSDCLCIVPHDAGARRVALCFAEPPVREGFALTIPLDTGEVYGIARLGSDTDSFFTKLVDARDESVASWHAAQRALEDNLPVRLGEAAEAHKAFRSLNADVTCGLFSADEEAFWEPLTAFRKIWIYGAGRVARSVITRLRAISIRPAGVFVSSAEGNPAELLGVPVREIGTADPGEDSAVVVAMAVYMQDGPAARLREMGCTYFRYCRNVLEGPFRPETERC
jgi:hypothetical protein